MSVPEGADILVVAGEESGDRLGAELMSSIAGRATVQRVWGLGGHRLAATGADLLGDAARTNVSGFLEVARRYPYLRRTFEKVRARATLNRPDLAILVDYPGFNLPLARALHALHVPVVYYVAPQTWAWKEGRVATLRDAVDDLIVVFPFEVDYFSRRGINVQYFGNPHAEASDIVRTSTVPGNKQGQLIAYLPGSRRSEVEHHLPLMVRIAQDIGPSYRHVIARASTIDPTSITRYTEGTPFQVVEDALSLLAEADVAVVKAGTSTLDAMLAGVPFVTVYRTSLVSYLIGRALIRVPYIAMPNLLAGRSVVNEYIQHAFVPNKVAQELRTLLTGSERRLTMIDEFARLRAALHGKGAVEGAGRFIAQKYLTKFTQINPF